MYEFYGDGRKRSKDLTQEFRDFSGFLDLCVSDARAAEQHLTGLGFDGPTSIGLVRRFSKETRRLQLDLKQERDQRVLAIQHCLESEVLEASIDNGDISAEAVNRFVNELVPQPGVQLAGLLGPGVGSTPAHSFNIQVNQQIINAVESTVMQNIGGTADLGPKATQLLELIAQHGGAEAGNLSTALYELEDPDARKSDRLAQIFHEARVTE